MVAASDRKLYLGPRLRRLRRELGINQTRMAEELGVSPSYLNHLERNQRPLTAQILLRLANTYDIDVRDFVAGANEAAASDLHEIFADDLVREIGIGRQEVLEVAENYPGVAEAVKRLYRALADLRQLPARVETAGALDAGLSSPLAWSRDWLDRSRNHFPELDEAAEALSISLGEGPEPLREAMVARLRERHGTSVRVVPQDLMPGALRHFDFHRRRLLLSERLPPASRLFETAVQLAQSELGSFITNAVVAANPPDAEARALAQQIVTNYGAAAVVMPYARFRTAAEAGRYDLDLLSHRFGASIEQVAHRLTTLDRQGARGVPLFLLKLDAAGNVAKRFAEAGMPFARFGGGCPRWRVHRALRRPGETVVDLAVLPGGATYLTWARAISTPASTEPTLLVLGCDARHADRIGYAAVAGEATPIGPACHLCERPDCTDRSLPPITRALAPEPFRRPATRYTFRRI